MWPLETITHTAHMIEHNQGLAPILEPIWTFWTLSSLFRALFRNQEQILPSAFFRWVNLGLVKENTWNRTTNRGTFIWSNKSVASCKFALKLGTSFNNIQYSSIIALFLTSSNFIRSHSTQPWKASFTYPHKTWFISFKPLRVLYKLCEYLHSSKIKILE